MSQHQENIVLSKRYRVSVSSVGNYRKSKPELFEALELHTNLNANIENSVFCPACETQQSLSSILIGGDICKCDCGEIIHTRRVRRCDSCKKKIKLTLCDAESGEIWCEECTMLLYLNKGFENEHRKPTSTKRKTL